MGGRGGGGRPNRDHIYIYIYILFGAGGSRGRGAVILRVPAVGQAVPGLVPPGGLEEAITWVAVKIMVPFWVPNIRHLLLRVPKKGPLF